MSGVCVDVGAMWRLSEDFNRRFAARVHHHHHRPTVPMIYTGNLRNFKFFGSMIID